MSKYVEGIYDDYMKFHKQMFLDGFDNGSFRLYNEEEIARMRETINVLPISITLLCNNFCIGKCYTTAFHLSRIFLDTDDDIRLVCADVDELRFNPNLIKEMDEDPLYANHCFLIRQDKDGKKYVYDTNRGLVFDYDFYTKLESPRYRKIVGKQYIRDHLEALKRDYPKRFEIDPIYGAVIIDLLDKMELEKNGCEFYSKRFGGQLEHEIELLKKRIDYDTLKVEKAEEIKTLKKQYIEFQKEKED